MYSSDCIAGILYVFSPSCSPVTSPCFFTKSPRFDSHARKTPAVILESNGRVECKESILCTNVLISLLIPGVWGSSSCGDAMNVALEIGKKKAAGELPAAQFGHS